MLWQMSVKLQMTDLLPDTLFSIKVITHPLKMVKIQNNKKKNDFTPQMKVQYSLNSLLKIFFRDVWICLKNMIFHRVEP